MKRKILLSLFVLVLLAIVVLLGILLLSQNNNTGVSDYEKLKDDIEVLVIDPATFVPYTPKPLEGREGTGSGGPFKSIEEYDLAHIEHLKKLTGRKDLVSLPRPPVSFAIEGTYVSNEVPFPGMRDILYKATVKNLTDYVDKGKITTERSEWDVYNYTNRKFKDLYSIYYDPSRDNGIDYVLHNKKDEKFIVLGPEIPLDDDLEGLLLAIARYFEESYEVSKSIFGYQIGLLSMEYFTERPYGIGIQEGFHTLRGELEAGYGTAIGAKIKGKWEINSPRLPGDDSFIKFLLEINPVDKETRDILRYYLKSELEKTPVSYVQIDNY